MEGVPDERDLRFEFFRRGGPGGQNVNKVSTAVRIWYDFGNSATLPAWLAERLSRFARRTADGREMIVVEASEHRTQGANRALAMRRLAALIEEAALPDPPERIGTVPTGASRERRRRAKRGRSSIKTARRVDVGELLDDQD